MRHADTFSEGHVLHTTSELRVKPFCRRPQLLFFASQGQPRRPSRFLETASVTLFKWMPCTKIVGAVTPPEMMKRPTNSRGGERCYNAMPGSTTALRTINSQKRFLN
jgi:hypothetical protein